MPTLVREKQLKLDLTLVTKQPIIKGYRTCTKCGGQVLYRECLQCGMEVK